MVRDGLPAATMPRRLRPRLEWVEALEFAIAVDAAATFEELRAEGWGAAQAADCAGPGLVRWLTDHLEQAAAVGLAFARAADEAPPPLTAEHAFDLDHEDGAP